MARINQMFETIEAVIDEKGEYKQLHHTTNTSYNLEQEPPYVKLYLDTILYLKDIPKGYNPVLLAILQRIPWANQNQEIAINAHIKRGIAKELKCSYSTVEHAMTDFVRGEVLQRVGLGTYQVNPHLFGRGEWKDIAKLRLTIDFDANGKTVMGEITRKKRKTAIDPNQLTLQMTTDETTDIQTTAISFLTRTSE